MTELQILEAKAKVLTLYAEHMEHQLLTFAQAMARDGYDQAQIMEAIETTRPMFNEGAKKALRHVTIAAMHAEALSG